MPMTREELREELLAITAARKELAEQPGPASRIGHLAPVSDATAHKSELWAQWGPVLVRP